MLLHTHEECTRGLELLGYFCHAIQLQTEPLNYLSTSGISSLVNSSVDTETLELTYRCSQLTGHLLTARHTPNAHTAVSTVSQVQRGPDGPGDAQMGRGMLRWVAFLGKLKPGGTFFQIWVVRGCNVGQART